MIKTKMRRSNWEVAVFLIVAEITSCSNAMFYRSQIMTDRNQERANGWLAGLGHKKNQKSVEFTMQRTMQNLRDKGFIDFKGGGVYSLTDAGVEECGRVLEETLSKGNSIGEGLEKHKEDALMPIINRIFVLLAGRNK